MKAVIFTHVLYLILMKGHMAKGVAKCESKVELRAVMLSCPAKDTGCDDDDPLSQVMKSEESQILQADSTNFEALKAEKEKGFPNEVKDCKRKLVITLKVKNVGKIPCDDEYIVVDHVFDPVTGGRGRLLSPVVVKLRQEQMIQLYGLQFQKVVNSDPFEEQKAADRTCSVDPENPTCGIVMHDGKPIPFSEGFCCSSDAHLNEKRQLAPPSRRDSFLYRDSKLISQGNTRPVREEKHAAGTIVDPELVKLKSGKHQICDSKCTDCGGIGDPLNWEKVPNYLLENDRKIVCEKGDFMRELCLSRGDKMLEKEKSWKKKKDKSKKKGKKKAKHTTTSKVESTTVPSVPKPDQTSDALGLQNFLEGFNSSRPNSAGPLEGFDPTNGSRGKRENRESKKLSLEEKLDRFVSLKKHMTNRRKRLLELSHRRFRKSGECTGGQESQQPSPQKHFLEEYPNTSPPGFFFSHDRAIIDPLEPAVEGINSTCGAFTKNLEFADGARGKTYRHPEKTESLRSFKEDRKDKMMDQSLRRGQSKFESKLERKDKYTMGKFVGKKDKVKVSEGGRAGIGEGRERNSKIDNGKASLKEVVEYKGGRKFDIFEQKEGLNFIRDEQRSQQCARSFKNFLHKNEFERKPAKPKLKSISLSKSREKQRFMKGHKKLDFNHRGGFNEEFKKKMERIENKGSKVFEKQEDRDKKQVSNKYAGGGLSPLKKDSAEMRPKHKEGRNYLKEPTKKTGQGSRFQSPEDMESNVFYNVEIIRNRIPESSKRRLYSTLAEAPVKYRNDGSSLKSAVHGIDGKSQYQKSAAHFSPSQNYYMIKSDDPHSVYVVEKDNAKNRPRLESTYTDPANVMGRAQPSYNSYPSYRKANRHFAPAAEDEENSKDSERQKLLELSHGNEQPVAPPREDSVWKHHESRENMGSGLGEEPQRVQHDNTRNKRSASYCFQPARGFYESELDFGKPDEHVVRELVTLMDEGLTNRGTDARQFSRSKHENFSANTDAFSESRELLSRLSCRTLNSRDRTNGERNARLSSDEQRLIQSYANVPDYVLKEMEQSLKDKRQANEPRKSINTRAKPSPEKDDYIGEQNQDTAHCMRFGDLWYSLYMIKQPVVSQIVGLQLYDKHSFYDGTTQWRDLTKGKMIRIGTFLQKAEDDLPTMSLTFMGEKTRKVEGPINPDNYFLLIPSHVSDPSKVNSYPQLEGGPAEYLLVETKDVSSGGECNMIGTSFEAFARQPDRCSQRQGSCLKRQPIDLWREDMEARIRGKKGKYFVENFGNVPNSPVKTYTNLTGEYLALEYYGEYTSTIEIEVKADSNVIVRKGSDAQIPMVYVDSTYPKKTRIILSVLNIGLTTSYFRPRLGDCPPKLDPSWCPLEGPLVTIPPHQRHDFKLDLSGSLPCSQVVLTVEVLDQVNKQVAFRKIIIKKGDRCLCAFHCKCNCVGHKSDGRICRRLDLKEYRKAGYIGSYPFRGGAAFAPETLWGSINIVFLTASYVLLFLGMMKGILGIFFRRLGIAGTRIITGPTNLCAYYECELSCYPVRYDASGFPVHPITCQPVQIVPLSIEVIVNFFFFFLYPLRGICFFFSSLPFCKRFCVEYDTVCHNEEGDSDHRCSCPLLSKPPHHNCINCNLTTVESKKFKQEHLLCPSYKGDDDPLEEDDTEFVLREMKRYRKK